MKLVDTVRHAYYYVSMFRSKHQKAIVKTNKPVRRDSPFDWYEVRTFAKDGELILTANVLLDKHSVEPLKNGLKDSTTVLARRVESYEDV